MGTTSEDYLDSLLRAAMEPVSKGQKDDEVIEEVPQNEVDDMSENAIRRHFDKFKR